MGALSFGVPMTIYAADGDVAIDEAHFPDTAFRAVLDTPDYDTDGDHVLSVGEVSGVKYIEIGQKAVSSLKGIEYFSNLDTLLCYENKLTSVDVSKNTKLTTLQLFSNQLTKLDVSKNTALRWLYCSTCGLSSLDVSNNTKLIETE